MISVYSTASSLVSVGPKRVRIARPVIRIMNLTPTWYYVQTDQLSNGLVENAVVLEYGRDEPQRGVVMPNASKSGPRPIRGRLTGGWSQGLRDAGYVGPSAGIDFDLAACRTAKAAGHERICADVAGYPVEPFAGRVEGLTGSPPCQSFSAAGKGGGKRDLPLVVERIRCFARGEVALRRQWVDERSALVAEPMRWAVALRPRWIALEQVPTVLPLWQYTAHLLREQGYHAWTGALRSECYGVPQTRTRAVLMASLDRPVGPPEPTHRRWREDDGREAEGSLFGLDADAVTMAQALGWGGADRPGWTVTGGGAETGGAEVFGNARARQLLVQMRNSPLGNSAARNADEPSDTIFGQRSGNMEWTLRSNYGTDGDPGVRGERDENEPSSAVTGKAGRNRWVMKRNSGPGADRDPRGDDAPSYTIRAQGSGSHPSGTEWVAGRPSTSVCGDARIGRPGHKDWDQSESQFDRGSVRVSVQEAAILQSFPPDYPWQGNKSQRYQQVGSAIPPKLAEAILRSLLD